ncbi:hypothetical protein [Anaerotignum sp. MB30-C6]|uniref:hypothetical protein n=1 Tax=Anaerotignum sp. MB30-C6 TaxID=3070814 RepID=UPI0027DD5450|nr:hypothetical protein [Anaerotignum sp. MB30-C6]WMI81024.1 hypothetical protein RBQ60_14610 [Anaerotignum sp. MB30-C6]
MSLWLAIPVYWVLLWAASRWKRAYPLPFRFLEGTILAYLCFMFLPPAFLEDFLWAGFGAITGIVFGVWAEEKYDEFEYEKELRSIVIFSVAFLFEALAHGSWALPRSVIGGTALYCACAGLFPEGKPFKDAILSGMGGILGFILGVAVCFT